MALNERVCTGVQLRECSWFYHPDTGENVTCSQHSERLLRVPVPVMHDLTCCNMYITKYGITEAD